MKNIFFLFLVFFFNFALSQANSNSNSNLSFTKSHSELIITPEDETFYNGKNFFFGIKIKLNKDWKTYWKNPGDSGSPISIDWLEQKNIKNFQVLFPMPESFLDHEVNTIGYNRSVIFPIKIEVLDNNAAISGELSINYLVCKEICIPVNLKKKVSFSNIKNLTNSQTDLFKTIQNIPSEDKNFFKIIKKVKSKQNEFNILIEPVKNSRETNFKVFAYSSKNDLKVKVKQIDDKINVLVFSPEDIFNDDSKVELVVSNNNLIEKFYINTSEIIENTSILSMLILALLGGIILNFMPCVLPILSLKIFSFLSLREKQKFEIFKISSLSIAGIIFSFLIIALFTIFFKALGSDVGWGSQFQSKEFLMIFSLILLFFSLNLFGFFELTLPQKLLNFLNIKGKNKNFEAFLSGALATTLATPCSAPFLGTSVGFALSQGNMTIIMIFLSLGIGFSLPYILIMISPKFLNFFPKPGNWMNDLKKFLAFSVLITALWLLKLFGINNLILLSLFLGFPLLSTFFIEKRNFRNISSTLTILTLTILLYLNLSLKGNEKNWVPFDLNLIQEDIINNNIVFVDVTADWCITCKVNKITSLNTREVRKFFNKNSVILYKADWTNKDKVILNFLKQNGRYGIPFNIVYGPSNKKGVVLPEILTKETIFNAINLVK